jgi:hypothetical protein
MDARQLFVGVYGLDARLFAPADQWSLLDPAAVHHTAPAGLRLHEMYFYSGVWDACHYFARRMCVCLSIYFYYYFLLVTIS